jgi:hypothetical protein
MAIHIPRFFFLGAAGSGWRIGGFSTPPEWRNRRKLSSSKRLPGGELQSSTTRSLEKSGRFATRHFRLQPQPPGHDENIVSKISPTPLGCPGRNFAE